MSAAGGASVAARREPTRPAGLTLGRLAWLQTTHRRGTAACLGLCLAIAILLPALLPLLDGYALERAVADAAASDGGFTVQQKVSNVDQFGAFQREVAARVDVRAAGVLLPLAAFASTAPLYPVTRNTDPVPADLSGRAFQASYLDGLPDHIEMQAGQLPPDGLGGGDTAVTIPQAGADLAGLNLFDRICLSFTPGAQRQSSWCARIVGLWRPLDVRDPFWGGRAPQLEFVMGRYDFFQLARRQPPQGATAGLRYWVEPAAVDAARSLQLADTVRGLAAELRTPERQVATRLDAALLRVSDQHRTLSATLHLFTAALALLGLVVVGLLGVRFLREQSHLLAVLRARGWQPARAWLQAFVGLAAPGLYGIPLALGACLVVLALVGPAGTPAGAAALRSGQGRAALYVACVLAALVVLLLATIAASAVWRELRPSLEGPFRPGWTDRSRRLLAVFLALLGLGGMLGVLLPSPPSGPASDALALALAAPPMLGVLCLALAAALLPLSAKVRGGGSVPALLAAWQLKRGPAQHAALAAALALAAAASALAVLTVVWARPDEQVALQPALRAGMVATLGLGTVAVLALLLIGTAVHGASITWRRLDEYAGLLGHGLSGRQIRGSLGRERVVTASRGLILGALLGFLLAALMLERSLPPFPTIAAALAGLAAVVVALLVGVLAVGALAGRLPDRLDPLRGPPK